MSAGIDYGMGQTNIDKLTGIRFGVISMHDITQAWADSSEADYGPPHCPKCGNQADEQSAFGATFQDEDGGYTLVPDDYTSEPHECDDYVCVDCLHFFGSESAFGDEPLGYYLDDGEYLASDCLDSDVMVMKSPFYTYGPFCSPCVPGAVNLNDASSKPGTETGSDWDGAKAYCFGHDWFEDGKAPYRVFRVADDTEVMP